MRNFVVPSPNIVRLIKSNSLRWVVEHRARMLGVIAFKILTTKPTVTGTWERLGIDERTIV